MGDQVDAICEGGNGVRDRGYTDADVLFKRGGHTSSHVGNVRHNDLVFALVEQLIANDGAASLADIDSIRGEIRRTGGRYMGRDASTGVWTELGEEESRDKVDQAIRSRISWFRKEGRPDRPIREIDALQDNDFRLGRGMTSPAIDRFHEMMDQWVPYYWRATRKAKSKIRALLLLSWRQQEPPGRFVKTSTFHGKMVLHELGDDARQIQALPIKYLTRKTSNLKGTLDIDEAKVEELQLVFNDAIGGPATIHRETVGQTHTDPSFPTSQLSSPTCTDKYVYCWVSPEQTTLPTTPPKEGRCQKATSSDGRKPPAAVTPGTRSGCGDPCPPKKRLKPLPMAHENTDGGRPTSELRYRSEAFESVKKQRHPVDVRASSHTSFNFALHIPDLMKTRDAAKEDLGPRVGESFPSSGTHRKSGSTDAPYKSDALDARRPPEPWERSLGFSERSVSSGSPFGEEDPVRIHDPLEGEAATDSFLQLMDRELEVPAPLCSDRICLEIGKCYCWWDLP